MTFTSVSFVFYFLPVFLLVYFSAGRFKNITLLVFSLGFYAWGEPRFVPVLLLYIFCNYLFGLRIAQSLRFRNAWMIFGVVANIGLLFYFKYINFFSQQLSFFAQWTFGFSTPLTDVALPLGVSFIAFQGVSYVIDVYRGTVSAQKGLVDFAMYKAMFPQLIAGPIVRYSDVANDISSRPFRFENIELGLRQFVIGLGMKVLVANIVAGPADQIFALSPKVLGATTAWMGILCYTLQIYFDFAGYSLMAIGLGRVMGFCYPVNFNRPYVAQSVTEFWRRWHISLSSWFRDYLYVPLGGNRLGPVRTYGNLFLVFLVCGFWHGANWTFLFWGGYHGVFLVIERLGLKQLMAGWLRPVRHVYLIVVIMVGWVFFRCDTLSGAFQFIWAMAGGGGGSPVYPASRYLSGEVMTALVAGTVFAVAPFGVLRIAASATQARGTVRGVAQFSAVAANVLLAGVLWLSILEIAGGAYSPFIYFRF